MAYPIIQLSIRGNPVPKGRPRFGNGRTFTPQATIDAEDDIAWAFKQKYPGLQMDEKSSFAIYLYFYMKTKRRQDWDNLAKLVCDALNGLAYKDDSQIVEASVRVIRGDKNPRTEITLAAID